jgi:hypothetical protein
MIIQFYKLFIYHATVCCGFFSLDVQLIAGHYFPTEYFVHSRSKEFLVVSSWKVSGACLRPESSGAIRTIFGIGFGENVQCLAQSFYPLSVSRILIGSTEVNKIAFRTFSPSKQNREPLLLTNSPSSLSSFLSSIHILQNIGTDLPSLQTREL